MSFGLITGFFVREDRGYRGYYERTLGYVAPDPYHRGPPCHFEAADRMEFSLPFLGHGCPRGDNATHSSVMCMVSRSSTSWPSTMRSARAGWGAGAT